MARENFLFVGSSEGAVTIYGKKDHAFYHNIKPHSKGMLDMDIHSSGRLMLTLGMDFKMKLIDLASMSEVYHKNINPGKQLITPASEFLRFAPDQENLLLVVRDKILQFCSEDNSEKELKHFSSRVTCMISDSKNKLVVIGQDSGKLSICKYPSMECVSFQAYATNRVKDVRMFPEHNLLVTMSTEGMVSFWDIETVLMGLETLDGFDMDLENKLEHLYEFRIESRLVCLDVKVDNKIPQQQQEVAKVKSITVGKTYIEKLTKNRRKTRVAFGGVRVGAPQIRKLRKQSFIAKLKELRSAVASSN